MVGGRGRGGLSGELAASLELCRRLAADGFTRLPSQDRSLAQRNRDVPASDSEAVARHPGRYFEHHVKLALDRGRISRASPPWPRSTPRHLSRNALRVRHDGLERAVRHPAVSWSRTATALERLDALLAALAEGGYPVLSVEEEYVVHDSDPTVDAGWLDPGGISCPVIRGNSSPD